MAKQINARIVQKNDSLENWKKATGFIPEKGEFFLVNDYNFPIIIGDGKTRASELCKEPLIDSISDEKITKLFEISFKIRDPYGGELFEYSCIKGMTWDEFASSEYNINHFVQNDGFGNIYWNRPPMGGQIYVNTYDVIISGFEYDAVS